MNTIREWLSLRRRNTGEPLPEQTCFQAVSDLHLEIGQQYEAYSATIPRRAPYLVLAGNIGRLMDHQNYLAFLLTLTLDFDLVFLVLGNHEFYGLSYEDGIARAKQLVAESALNEKVVLLNTTRYDIEISDVTLLGCTLWSGVPEQARQIVNDDTGFQ